MTKDQIPAEAKKSLQDFVVAYFFVFRTQIRNAELIEQTLMKEVPKNALLTELAHGYIGGTVYEFALLLYDAVDVLKSTTGTYKFKTDGAIFRIFQFRRHILAHRARNWGSAESKETIEFFSQGKIYSVCHEAAREFVEDLKQYLSFEPIEKIPAIQKIRKPDLESLLRNSPQLEYFYQIHNLDEITNFFGTDMRPSN